MTEPPAGLFRSDLGRLVQELRAFPDDAVLWRTVPSVKNSAGNLALHAALTPERLAAPYPDAPGALQPTRLFLLSLYGHLNYHLGQIGYLRRVLTGGKPREAYE